MTARQIEHPVADVLRVLAVSRSSGALEVRGLRSGTFFLHDGDITYAEALGVPPAEEFDPADPRLRATIQSSIVEVGLNLLAEENIEGERPLFRPGRRHWSGRAIRIEVESLLAEIAQQLKNFTKLGVEPDDEVQLCGLPPGRTVVLNRQQWALTAEMFGPQTARSLARRSGASLSATIETVASLVRAGLVRRGVPASVVPAPPTTPIPTDPLPTGPFPPGPSPTGPPTAPRPSAPSARVSSTREVPGAPNRAPPGRAPEPHRVSESHRASESNWVSEPHRASESNWVAPVRAPDPNQAQPNRGPDPNRTRPVEPLPHRVRGATPMPNRPPMTQSPPGGKPRTPPRTDIGDLDSSRALALRLLEGLRRL